MLVFPLINDTSRKIIHVDMDAFFASIEERDNPELKGKPVVIAKNPLETGGRGVVSTANYAARKYGIHSAMSAKKLTNFVRKPFLYRVTMHVIKRFHARCMTFFIAILMRLRAWP